MAKVRVRQRGRAAVGLDDPEGVPEGGPDRLDRLDAEVLAGLLYPVVPVDPDGLAVLRRVFKDRLEPLFRIVPAKKLVC